MKSTITNKYFIFVFLIVNEMKTQKMYREMQALEAFGCWARMC